jgi:hypothetical protein
MCPIIPVLLSFFANLLRENACSSATAGSEVQKRFFVRKPTPKNEAFGLTLLDGTSYLLSPSAIWSAFKAAPFKI